MSWYKRREPTKEIAPVSVEVENLQLIPEHRCVMKALYDDGIVYELTGRVCFNDIKKTWTVHGLNHTGQSVLCDISEVDIP